MQVYAEYALLENFCMDFTLLVAAKYASKNPAKYWRIALASVLGACFAVVYPLFGVGGAAGIAIKLFAGGAMCALAGKYQSVKGYVKFTALFTAATFLTGGLLIAVFSLAGVKYAEGGGYLLSSVPVGIPLFCVLALVLIIRKVRNKIVSVRNVEADCRIYSGGLEAACPAFYDSGNKVYFKGAPVSIIPARVAKKLAKNILMPSKKYIRANRCSPCTANDRVSGLLLTNRDAIPSTKACETVTASIDNAPTTAMHRLKKVPPKQQTGQT